MGPSFSRLARRQLSEILAPYAAAAARPAPSDGWIAAIRTALDMTVRQLAGRLDVAPSGVTRLEGRERDGTISIGALRAAANALDCELVYAVVPRHHGSPGGKTNLLEAMIEVRAQEVAAAELAHVAHSMALEDQSVPAADLRAQVAERAAALVNAPRRLWDVDVEP